MTAKQLSLFRRPAELRREATTPPLTALPLRAPTQRDREIEFMTHPHLIGSRVQRRKALEKLGISTFGEDSDQRYLQILKDLRGKYRTPQ